MVTFDNMQDFNTTILAVAAVLTVLLAIVNIMQVVMMSKGVNPLTAEGSTKYVAVIIMIALLALLIAHIVTFETMDGVVGKDNKALMACGGLSTVFMITTCGAFFLREKLADKAQFVYFASLALLWICLIAHIVLRATA